MVESKDLFPAQNINHSHPLVAVAQEQELLVGGHLKLSQSEAFCTVVGLQVLHQVDVDYANLIENDLVHLETVLQRALPNHNVISILSESDAIGVK